MPGLDDFTWVGVAERVATAGSATVGSGSTGLLAGYGPAASLRAKLIVASASGSAPALTVAVKDTLDGGVSWNELFAFGTASAPGSEVVNHTSPFADAIQVEWTIGGGDSEFAFTVDIAAQD